MRVFDGLIGQQSIVELLRPAIAAAHDIHSTRESSLFTHAWLFTGPPGSGRSVLAQRFAAAIQCENPEFGCGACRQCQQVLSGAHPDVVHIVPEGVFISIEEIRNIIFRAAQRPTSAKWNILIIEDADRLTESASNALLKTIEEPPPHTVIMLCAPSAEPEDIATTIKSRCRHLRLGVPDKTEIACALVKDGVPPDQAAWVSQISAGHIGRARRLAADEKSRELRQLILNLPRAATQPHKAYQAVDDFLSEANAAAQGISHSLDSQETEELKVALGAGSGAASSLALRGSAGAFKALEKKQKMRSTRVLRDIIDIGLLDLAGLFRDAMVYSMGSTVSAIHPDYEDMVSKMADYIDATSWLRCLLAVLAARDEIDHNVKPKYALSAMMAKFQQELVKQR